MSKITMLREIQTLLSETVLYYESSGIEYLETASILPGNEPAAAITVSTGVNVNDKTKQLELVAAEVAACRLCALCKQRKNSVFGEGYPRARLMFIGEAPGADEDMQGRPFVGRAGQLLDKIILSMGLQRSEVYIANIVKCRPEGNRAPSPEESGLCMQYLKKQIALIQPEVICTLGAVATGLLLDEKRGITKLRGHFHTYNNIKVMPTFHPAYLLRNPAQKARVWEDVQQIMKLLKL